ncbi:hypothetical protein ACLKA7_006366 [Drosophila subpalustris]
MPEIRKQQTPVNGNELSHDQTQKQNQTQTQNLTRNLAQNRNKSKSGTLSPQEKRIALITAMAQFKPKNATPIQFYNFVREFCIMHNCSIDEAMERAPMSWTKLSKDQRQLYNSEMHAALPIPVPRHLVYRAFQMERAGRWKLSSVPAGKGGSIMYSVESYAPPTKPTRMQTRIRAEQPRFDNLAETSPCYLESPRYLNAARKLRTVTPPEQKAQRSQQQEKTRSRSHSLTHLLSAVSVKENGLKKPMKCKSKKALGSDKKFPKQQTSKMDIKGKHSHKKCKKKF